MEVEKWDFIFSYMKLYKTILMNIFLIINIICKIYARISYICRGIYILVLVKVLVKQ